MLGLLDCSASVTRVVAPLCAGYMVVAAPFGPRPTSSSPHHPGAASAGGGGGGDVLAPWLLNAALCFAGALALWWYPRVARMAVRVRNQGHTKSTGKGKNSKRRGQHSASERVRNRRSKTPSEARTRNARQKTKSE